MTTPFDFNKLIMDAIQDSHPDLEYQRNLLRETLEKIFPHLADLTIITTSGKMILNEKDLLALKSKAAPSLADVLMGIAVLTTAVSDLMVQGVHPGMNSENISERILYRTEIISNFIYQFQRLMASEIELLAFPKQEKK